MQVTRVHLDPLPGVCLPCPPLLPPTSPQPPLPRVAEAVVETRTRGGERPRPLAVAAATADHGRPPALQSTEAAAELPYALRVSQCIRVTRRVSGGTRSSHNSFIEFSIEAGILLRGNGALRTIEAPSAPSG